MGWSSSTSIGFVFILAFLSILKAAGFWNSSTSIFLVFILAFLSILKTAGFWNNNRSQNFPPGPRPLPIIGNLLLFDLKRPYRTHLQLSKIYGPVFSVQMGLRKVVVISGYETVKEALVNQADAFAERPDIPIFQDLTKGNGILFAHGENWKVMRRFTLTALRDFGMGKKAIEDRIVEEYGYLADTIASQEGNPIDASKIINAAVANIIVSILFGKRFDYKDSRFVRLLNLTNENMRLAGKPLVTVYNIFPYLGFLLRANKPLLRNRNEFHDFLRSVFAENLKNLDKNDQRSFIDAYLVKQQEEKSTTNGYFHNDNLLSLVSNLFTAGVETITTTLNWGFLLMLKYPEIQKKVQEEIEQVIGSNPPRIEHRAQMPYTDAVIHEIQRFANILPLDLPHETAADVTLKGYFIPKGTFIIPLLTSVLKDQSQWEKPDTFYPEHFLDANGKFVKRDAFMPFSAGAFSFTFTQNTQQRCFCAFPASFLHVPSKKSQKISAGSRFHIVWQPGVAIETPKFCVNQRTAGACPECDIHLNLHTCTICQIMGDSNPAASLAFLLLCRLCN